VHTDLFLKRNQAMAKITDAVEILKRKMGIDPDTDPEMLQISEDLRVAQMIFDARTEAGLTQKDLAQAVGTTQSVISQLESAEYKGHSLTMLERIAKALNRRVEIRLAPRAAVNRTA
jgi:ribosome-binding protein aMBF1 (putative translation factor)